MFTIDDIDFEEDFDEKQPLKDTSNNNSFLQIKTPAKQQKDLLSLLDLAAKKHDSPLNKSNINSPHGVAGKSEKVIRPRKFPGPAGLLPERNSDTSLVATEDFLNELENDSKANQEFEEKEVCSQQTAAMFENSDTWSAFLADLGDDGSHLLKSLNLAKLKILKKNPRGCKVPFLAVMVASIDGLLKDPFLHLKDFSGEIHAILHRDVWENWNMEISPGSVLVLRNVGIIAAGGSIRRYILNITENNITAIYYTRPDSEVVQTKNMGRMPTSLDSSQILRDWKTTIDNFSNFSTPPRPSVTNSPGFTPLFNQFNINKSSGRDNNVQPAQKKFRPNQQFNRHQSIPSPAQRPSTSKPVVQSLFQVSDSDTSIVESLFDGLDTNDLFCDF